MYTYICLVKLGIFSCMRVNVSVGQQRATSLFLALKPTAFQIKWIHVLLRQGVQLKTNPDLQSMHPVPRL